MKKRTVFRRLPESLHLFMKNFVKKSQQEMGQPLVLKDSMLFIYGILIMLISYCNYPKIESNDYPLCDLCCKNTICRGCWLDQPEMDRYHPVGSHQWYGQDRMITVYKKIRRQLSLTKHQSKNSKLQKISNMATVNYLAENVHTVVL